MESTTLNRDDALPFRVIEVARPDAAIQQLFRRLFKAAAPDFPRHFAAYHDDGRSRSLAAYMHFTVQQPGVFLIGGLGVDARIYRRLPAETRKALANRGSLSRWFSHTAIAALGPKRAVFAYTGDTRSRRDAEALGFQQTAAKYLFVQWHDETPASRAALVAQIDALGPF